MKMHLENEGQDCKTGLVRWWVQMSWVGWWVMETSYTCVKYFIYLCEHGTMKCVEIFVIRR
jgi:hypothetical protein